VVALFATVASSEENQATRVDDVTGSGSGEPSDDTDTGTGEPEAFAVGDLVQLGDWHIRVHGVTDPLTSGNQFLNPAAGNRWVGVDAEVTNNGTNAQVVSSILCFELLDSANVEYTMALAPDAQQPPDGEVAPGTSRRGTLVYEVPEGATGLRLSFKCDLFSTGSAVINLG
jgi:hypothetical protein